MKTTVLVLRAFKIQHVGKKYSQNETLWEMLESSVNYDYCFEEFLKPKPEDFKEK